MKLKIFLILILLALCVCCANAENGADSEFVVAIASDLHMQEPKPDRIEANPLMYYQREILASFVSDVSELKPDILLLSGDITNQGKRKQHELMLDLLRNIENNGTKVYVLPGNHDIGEVTPEMFAEIYADFGYADAYSRDDYSLSYSLLIRNHMILMLDTNGYSGNRMTAFLSEPTLKWMEQQLSVAQRYGYRILVAGHYPLVTEHVTPFEGKEEAIRLLREYDVPMYVCGHMHLRGVAGTAELTELVVDQTVSYPCAYAVVTMGDGYTQYSPRKTAVAKWAAENGVDDPRILNFDDFQTALTENSLDLTIDALIGDQKISENDKNQMTDFFRRFRYGLADGTLYKNRNILKEHSGYRVFMQYAGNTSYGRWIPSVLEKILPYTNGFRIENGRIFATDND